VSASVGLGPQVDRVDLHVVDAVAVYRRSVAADAVDAGRKLACKFFGGLTKLTNVSRLAVA